MKDNLFISEKFYSIQGEGQTMGVPSIFIRLSGCNILCQSADWVCDSIEVWKKGTKTAFEEVFSDIDIMVLKRGAHLIFTGGEPLMHQKRIVDFIEWIFEKYGFLPIIEVETNGTIMPNEGMIANVEFWNCSPKLANSGEPYERRVKPLVIQVLNNLKSRRRNIIFKFVVSKREDFLDILQDYGSNLLMQNVCLMPAGETQEKLNETRPMVAQLCIEHGLRYSERLHIVIWNQKTGV